MEPQLIMKGLLREHMGEALVGLAVVVLAIWFVLFAWNQTGGGARAGAMHVKALFQNASGVNVGTDVRVAGMKVGTIAGQRLDAESYMVELTMALDPQVKVPADSSAAITSEGLLGATYVALLPGGDPQPLKDGDTIIDTQGAVDLMGMIGQFITKPSAPAEAQPEAAPAP